MTKKDTLPPFEENSYEPNKDISQVFEKESDETDKELHNRLYTECFGKLANVVRRKENEDEKPFGTVSAVEIYHRVSKIIRYVNRITGTDFTDLSHKDLVLVAFKIESNLDRGEDLSFQKEIESEIQDIVDKYGEN